MLLVVFVLVERRAAEPIVPLHLFANGTYSLVNVASFFTAFCMYAGVVFLPRYFQEAHGLSATSSGLHIYPLMLAMVVGSAVTGALISRTRRYKPWLVIAPVFLVAGTALCANLEVGTSTPLLVTWMALIGLGMGPMLSGLTVAIQTAVPPRFIGTASANLTFFRQIGGSVALAVAGTAYGSVVTREAPLHGLPAAHAAATATVIPWLGVVGAVVALLALALLPGVDPQGGVRLDRPAPQQDLVAA
ncbi:MFS transporter [Microbispora sp. GKU 823]|uniref:MFS transporter n=1 Tax=Microbispora sp. GKU 823 TaxID=1652100 RepID=UPI002118B7FC|nr:MFS transporter [Microbispora sp. GKU 823]